MSYHDTLNNIIDINTNSEENSLIQLPFWLSECEFSLSIDYSAYCIN